MNDYSSRNNVEDERTCLLPVHDPESKPGIYFTGDDATIENTEEESKSFADESQSLLYRKNVIQTGGSIGPESQTCAMFTDSQLYGTIRDRPRRLSNTSSLKRVETTQSNRLKSNSPYLTGISVKRFWLIFAVTLISFFIAVFDSTIMVSSHPVITSYFKSSNSASWLSTAFLLTFTGFQPLFGGLSDAIGRRKPLVFCLFVLTFATMWCGLAQSMTSFIIARAFCGLGAGGLVSLSSIVISDLVPIEIRGIYQSYINVAFGLGSASGAALGGWIADSLGWRWEFGIQIPTLVVCLCIACVAIPSNMGIAEGAKERSLLESVMIFDYKGSILLTTSITFLILGLNLGGNILLWTHPLVIISFIIFIVFFPLLIYVESRATHPIMPPKIMFRNPRATIILVNYLGGVVANTVTFNMPLFFQAVMLESATNSGLRLLVPNIVASVGGILVGFLITWTKQMKIYVFIGLVFSFIGSIVLSFLQRTWQKWVYLVLLVPTSLGQGIMYPTTFIAILSVSPQSEQAVVTSTLILWRSLGTVFGVSISSLILQNMLRFFLDRNVIGPDSKQVIEAVRKSVTAIYDLEPLYQDQVRKSYTEALRFTFGSAAILSFISIIICISLKLPRIGATPKL
ncbi:Vacuolar basic amino acid transporter 2 [Erysiphe neolycopersici]|uniref:Vacuolar basic amino acid transporter 2 n=1 Tax=Erysiphe neolycopersici TaxID=212602 RepID=A0A420H8U8_9PEZI|nr:Vacuolar basic amino acid transporter 2 [Erysiphe neolycopersici]